MRAALLLVHVLLLLKLGFISHVLRISLTNIINYASNDRKYQFIFLTPLNTDNIDVGDDLKIVKLSKRPGN